MSPVASVSVLIVVLAVSLRAGLAPTPRCLKCPPNPVHHPDSLPGTFLHGLSDPPHCLLTLTLPGHQPSQPRSVTHHAQMAGSALPPPKTRHLSIWSPVPKGPGSRLPVK